MLLSESLFCTKENWYSPLNYLNIVNSFTIKDMPICFYATCNQEIKVGTWDRGFQLFLNSMRSSSRSTLCIAQIGDFLGIFLHNCKVRLLMPTKFKFTISHSSVHHFRRTKQEFMNTIVPIKNICEIQF